MGMKINEILSEIYSLSKSQGFYGRLYDDLTQTREYDVDHWNDIVQQLESEEFETALDLVLYFEEGKHHKHMTTDELIQEIYSAEVQIYGTYDTGENVYIWHDMAYIGERGLDCLREDIKNYLKEE